MPIPSPYVQVEWVQGDNTYPKDDNYTQYITTGITVPVGGKLVVTEQCFATNPGTTGYGNNGMGYRLLNASGTEIGAYVRNSSPQQYRGVGLSGGNEVSNGVNAKTAGKVTETINLSAGTYQMVGSTTYPSFTLADKTTAYNLYLFGRPGSPRCNYNTFRIYNLKIYNSSGTLINEIVPAYNTSTGKYAFVDKVNGTVIPSVGSDGEDIVLSGAGVIIYNIDYSTTKGTAPASQTRYQGAAAISLRSYIADQIGSGTALTISFNANGGSSTPDSKTTTPTITYTQSSWKSSTGVTYTAGQSYSTDSNLALSAVWSEKSRDYPAITMPAAITRTGYIFGGWNTNSSGTGTNYTADTSYDPDTYTDLKTSRTLYAKWTTNTYDITYNANGHGTAPASQTKTYDTTLTLRSFIANVNGTTTTISFSANGGSSTPSAISSTPYYSQKYWNTESGGGGINYTSAGSYTANAAATLYAIWNALNYPAMTMPAAITRTGYTFGGWNLNSSGTGTNFTASTSYDPDTYTDLKTSRTLYAKWTAKTYTVTLDKQGGTGGSDSVTATYASAMPTITIPTKTGYTFGGYFTGTGGSGTQYYTATGTSAKNWDLTSNTTLYAKWTSKSYTISASSNPTAGGTITGAGSYNYGTTCTIKAIPNTNYDFVNWTKAGTVVSTSATYSFTVTDAATYVANFIKIPKLTVLINPVGSGTVTDSGTGWSHNLTAHHATMYKFLYWTLNGYTQLDYIESTGTQWIDTGLSGKMWYDADFERVNSTAPTYFWGYNNETYYTRFSLMHYYYSAAGNIFHLEVGFNGCWNEPIDTNRHKLSLQGTKLVVDGNTYTAAEYESTQEYETFRLFGAYHTGTMVCAQGMKLYSFKCYNADGTKLVRDYIPVIRHSDGAVGLLDLCNIKFYGNNGTGNFIPGPEKVV